VRREDLQLLITLRLKGRYRGADYCAACYRRRGEPSNCV